MNFYDKLDVNVVFLCVRMDFQIVKLGHMLASLQTFVPSVLICAFILTFLFDLCSLVHLLNRVGGIP